MNIYNDILIYENYSKRNSVLVVLPSTINFEKENKLNFVFNDNYFKKLYFNFDIVKKIDLNLGKLIFFFNFLIIFFKN
jgi:hypothetical protein